MDSSAPSFELRPASREDFFFTWALYRDLMKPLTAELLGKWNEFGQKRVVEEALEDKGTAIIVVDGTNVGWLQVAETHDSIYLGQLYILPSLQNRGIGTAVVRRLIDSARSEAKALTLDVMNNNRARLLYERLGFRVIGTSKYKLKMQWQEGS